MKELSSFEIFTLIKKYTNLNFLLKTLQIHKGTIKRWEQLKLIPQKYDHDLEKIITEIAIQNPEISAIRFKKNYLSNYQQFDEFYTTPQTALYCFQILKQQLQALNININDYHFIEPAAGGGSFFNLMPINKRIGIEINPHINKNYLIQDYLDFMPQNKFKYLVLGNPPFGLRGNLALRFINHSFLFADIVAFILPPLFASDGKGSPQKRVKGYQLAYSEKLCSTSFTYPDGTKVKIATIFQIWTKINTYLINQTLSRTAHNFIKIYSLSDGGTPGSTRNKKMLTKCDIYLPSTCFKGMKTYADFEKLPNRRGYGVKIFKNKPEIKLLLQQTKWEKIAFLSTNSALNLRMSLIMKVVVDAGFYD